MYVYGVPGAMPADLDCIVFICVPLTVSAQHSDAHAVQKLVSFQARLRYCSFHIGE